MMEVKAVTSAIDSARQDQPLRGLRMPEAQKLYLRFIEAVYCRHFFMALSAAGWLSKVSTNCPAFTQLLAPLNQECCGSSMVHFVV